MPIPPWGIKPGSSGSGSLTVGATTISGGTNGRLLYDNSSVLGELATTGSGNVVLATSPTIATATLTAPTIGATDFSNANHTHQSTASGGLISAASLTGTLNTGHGGTNLTSYTTGDLLYASSSSVLSKRGIGTSGQVLTVVSGVPNWADATGGSSTGSVQGIIVAASDAPAAWTAAANYVCDGTADDVEIQDAINDCVSDGTDVYLSPGTFNISATLTVTGDDTTDSDNVIGIYGAGQFQTNLVAGTNITIMKLQNSCKVDIQNILFNVNGSGDGIASIANTTSDPYRSFWDSSFKNLLFRGNANQTNHTGWAMNLGSPFRSTFENIEAYNVKNGIKLYSENAAFNPGDCTFIRCFMELGLNSGGIAYYTNGDPSVINQMTFINCEAFAYGASATGIKMDGSTGSMWNRFIGSNLEQFATVVDIESGEGNVVECNYCATISGTGGTFFKTAANAYNNIMQCPFMYADTNSTLWNDANTTTAQPNSVVNSKCYADTGVTFTLTTVTGSVLYGNVSDGPGTVPAAWYTDSRVITVTNKRITKRVLTTTSSATPSINTDNTDMFGLTAQTANITSFTTNLSGTPKNGDQLWIYIVGTASRTISWGSSFEASTVALPTTTSGTNRLDVGFVWNSATSKWRCVATC